MTAMGATPRPETSSDAIVVGGRVAGALTAAYLASAGLEVVVLDSSSVSSGTISTHFFRGTASAGAAWSTGSIPVIASRVSWTPRVRSMRRRWWWAQTGGAPPSRVWWAPPQQHEHDAARLLIYRYVTGYASPGPLGGAEFSLCRGTGRRPLQTSRTRCRSPTI